jgi:hypothetical protein
MNIALTSERLKAFPLRKEQAKMPTFATSTNVILKVLTEQLNNKKLNPRHSNWKEESKKLSVFTDNIIYVQKTLRIPQD